MIADVEFEILYNEFNGCFPAYTNPDAKIGGINRHATCASCAIWLDGEPDDIGRNLCKVNLCVYGSHKRLLHLNVDSWDIHQIRERLREIYAHIVSKPEIFYRKYPEPHVVKKELKRFFAKQEKAIV